MFVFSSQQKKSGIDDVCALSRSRARGGGGVSVEPTLQHFVPLFFHTRVLQQQRCTMYRLEQYIVVEVAAAAVSAIICIYTHTRRL